jgi:pimeloyl-ACP methyl ester carboxylesterase
VLAAVLAAALMPAGAGAAVRVTSVPVAFQVKNTNTTPAPCTPDGATYTVRGHLTGPRSLLRPNRARRSGVTLYLHGLGVAEWLWHFPVARYSHARAMALAGHASVTIDRLGYGASDKPASGKSVCIGSQADIAHQIVGQLRAGSYTATPALRFRRVGIAGHSASGQISITEASTYRDVRALVVVGFSFSNLPRANNEFGFQRIACDKGGDPFPTAPASPLSDYGFFGRSAADLRSIMFRSAPKAVQDTAAGLRGPDPCGDNYSLIPAIQRQPATVGRVRVPVLVICGRNDVLYAPFGCEAQAERFRRGSTLFLGNTGHGVPLERSARTLRKRLGRFLDRYRL